MINTDHKHLARAAFSLMVMDIGIKFSVSFNQNGMLREKLSGGKFRDLCYSKDYRSEQAHSLQREQPRQKTLLPPRSNGKPEAVTAVYKLLMMGKSMPEKMLSCI
jgi:hypothetical protein